MDFTVNEILNAYTFLFFLIRFGGSRVCVGQFHRFFTIFLFNIVFPARSRKPFGGKKKSKNHYRRLDTICCRKVVLNMRSGVKDRISFLQHTRPYKIVFTKRVNNRKDLRIFRSRFFSTR